MRQRRADRIHRRDVRRPVAGRRARDEVTGNLRVVAVHQHRDVGAGDRNAAAMLLQAHHRAAAGGRLHVRIGDERVPLVAAELCGQMRLRRADAVFAHAGREGRGGRFLDVRA